MPMMSMFVLAGSVVQKVPLCTNSSQGQLQSQLGDLSLMTNSIIRLYLYCQFVTPRQEIFPCYVTCSEQPVAFFDQLENYGICRHEGKPMPTTGTPLHQARFTEDNYRSIW
ncbi:unnamed protein product [Calypogeia fissa]